MYNFLTHSYSYERHAHAIILLVWDKKSCHKLCSRSPYPQILFQNKRYGTLKQPEEGLFFSYRLIGCYAYTPFLNLCFLRQLQLHKKFATEYSFQQRFSSVENKTKGPRVHWNQRTLRFTKEHTIS